MVSEKAVPGNHVFIKQKQVSYDQLRTIHSKEYLTSLETSYKLAQVTEFPPLAFVPYFIAKPVIMNPMWYQVGGTILGGELALKYGWSICLSGGMHHAYADDGGGWFVFYILPYN